MIRLDAQLSISRFAELIEVPRRTYTYRLAKHRAGDPPKGPWPAPVVDRIEPTVAKYAQEWSAWGHRKIRAIAAADGIDIGSEASVKRAMARRGLLQPVAYQAERRQLAKARRETFVDPPVRRNRVWQADFTEFETQVAGRYQIAPVCDYVTKMVLAAPTTTTQTASDLIAAFNAAEAAAGALLGRPLIEDCVDPDTGEIVPIRIVTDNGPAMKSNAIAKWFKARSHFEHVRTRHRSPHTNGVVERWIESLKYERLYRHDIADGIDLAAHVDDYVIDFNHIRPHEALDWARPIEAYLSNPNPQTEPTEN